MKTQTVYTLPIETPLGPSEVTAHPSRLKCLVITEPCAEDYDRGRRGFTVTDPCGRASDVFFETIQDAEGFGFLLELTGARWNEANPFSHLEQAQIDAIQCLRRYGRGYMNWVRLNSDDDENWA